MANNATFNPGVAASLSFLIPGLGQIYRRKIPQGYCWFFGTIFAYFCLFVPGVITHIICVCDANKAD